MKVSVDVFTAFMRVKKDANGHPGRIHLCNNEEPICPWEETAGVTAGTTFRNHPSGVERVSVDEFVAGGYKEACGECRKRLS